MIRPIHTTRVAPSELELGAILPGCAAVNARAAKRARLRPDRSTVLPITPLVANSDPRGSLSELLTTRDAAIEPIVHVYQVTAAAGSVRAWVYHRLQFDRLAFANGRFEIALFDIRPGSPTLNQLAVFILGRENPALLRIPPLVVHGVCNTGSETATFINMPTRAYDPAAPDKCRLSKDDPRIPYVFNARA